MSFHGLRDFLEVVELYGELKAFKDASWDLEMSSIAEIVTTHGKDPKPVLLFDDIPGHRKGYRTLFSLKGSPRRLALALNIAGDKVDRWNLLQNWRKKCQNIQLIPPKLVSSGPVKDNSMIGDQVDLLKFTTPRFHELDGRSTSAR